MRTDGLPAHADSAKHMGFYEELSKSTRMNSSGLTLGDDDKNWSIRHAFVPERYGDKMWGFNFNVDGGVNPPYWPRGNYTGVVKGTYPSFPKDDTFVMWPQSSYWTDLVYQDMKSDLSWDESDQHMDVISFRHRTYACAIRYRPDQSSPEFFQSRTASHVNMWMNRDPGGSWMYDHSMVEREAYDAITGAGGSVSYPRFSEAIARPGLVPYGQLAGYTTSGPSTFDMEDALGDEVGARKFFAWVNGAGSIPYVDHHATWREFARGKIPHMLMGVTYNAGNDFVRPARRTDGVFANPESGSVYYDGANDDSGTTPRAGGGQEILAPPQGIIVRLKRSAYLDAMDDLRGSTHVGAHNARVLIRALREYGFIIYDKYTYGTSGSDPGEVDLVDIGDEYNATYDGGNTVERFFVQLMNTRDMRHPFINLNLGTDFLCNPVNMSTGAVSLDESGYTSNGGSGTLEDYLDNNWNATVDATQHCLRTVCSIGYTDFETVDISSNLEGDYSMRYVA